MKYIYPKLMGKDLLFMRLGGNGLANSMLVTARASVICNKIGGVCLLRPTWERFSPSQYLKREKDKRTYRNLFKGSTLVATAKKIKVLLTNRKYTEAQFSEFEKADKGVLIVEGFVWSASPYKYLAQNYSVVCNYFNNNMSPKALKHLEGYDFSDTVAVHVRLGDYKKMNGLITQVDWYVNIIQRIKIKNDKLHFIIFSDGEDEELHPILQIKGTQRVFFGNALADIVAMSRCRIIIGSSSSFSAWGAFLGQVPLIAEKMHFGDVLKDTSKQYFANERNDIDCYLDSIGV